MNILRGDSYKHVNTPQEGDVVVWWDSNGDAVHSAEVVSVSDTVTEAEGISGTRDIGLVQQPGWLSHKSCRFGGFLTEIRQTCRFFNGGCSRTEVIEQLY
jgi:hypothetical protein